MNSRAEGSDLALALVSDDALHAAVAERTEALDLPCSFAFEREDFWEMLPKRPYTLVLAEVPTIGALPSSFLARVRRLQPGARVVFMIDGDADLPEGVNIRDSIVLPLEPGSIDRAIRAAGVEGVPPGNAGGGIDGESGPVGGIVGSSEAMRSLRERIGMFAPVDAYTLILGESGTGKECVARAIHAASARRDGPFVAVNCGSIPSEIIESELFGHLKGSFTGADRDRRGAFEQANGGILFLDEIGTMRLDHQVRLLRVLQDRQVAPVGSNSPVPVDVRVLAATNADLVHLMEEGRFREDLFYRLNVLLIAIPPLRERRDDIPDLARHFVRLSARRLGQREKEIAPEAMERLLGHPWKGNVRELENAIEHAMVVSLGRDVIEPLDLPGLIGERRRGLDRGTIRLTPDGIDLNDTVSRIERDMILQSLALSHGNKSRAAELLRLKRTTFVEKMKRYELADAEIEVSA